MFSKSNRWLILGFVLLVCATWLMTRDDDVTVGQPAQIDFPNYPSPAEFTRMEERRNPDIRPFARPNNDAPQQENSAPPKEPLDPLLRSFGTASRDESLMVFEANAIRHSALGEAFLNCLGGNLSKTIAEVNDEVGLNPLEDIDRMAVSDGGVVFSGHFENVRWGDAFKSEPESYGEHAQIFSRKMENPETEGDSLDHFAVWNNEMLIAGNSREELEARLDVIEGRQPMDHIPMIEEETYGEAYGNLSTKFLGQLIPEESAALREQILAIVSQVKIHSNAMSDVAISAELFSEGDTDGLNDLGRSLGGALSLGLAAAKLRGDEEFAQLLEFAKVSNDGDGLRLHLALPEAYLQEHLNSACKQIKDDEAARMAAVEAGEAGGMQEAFDENLDEGLVP